MAILKREVLLVEQEADIVLVRKLVRSYTAELKFSMINQTKLVTAASELARNIIRYATSGEVELCVIDIDLKIGIQLNFTDEGPGIPDIPKVMAGGYTTGGGLGLGLSGSKNLVDDFEIESIVGKGTRIKIILWR